MSRYFTMSGLSTSGLSTSGLSTSGLVAAVFLLLTAASSAEQLERIPYNNPGLVVDLGVGLWAWPLPMDYDGDGDMDLVVSCPDVPYNGVYLFENPGESSDSQLSTLNSQPVFKPAIRLGTAVRNIQISYVGDDIRVLGPGVEYRNFRENILDDKADLGVPAKVDPQYQRTRANQWKSVDYDGDGDQDLIVGLGVWDDYGWDDAWDENGNWTNGPLHGYVYLVENQGAGVGDQGSDDVDQPKYAAPVKLATTDGNPIDVYGMPSPNFADFDGDGDLDLICGEFMDGFTYFANVGTRAEPKYAAGKRLQDLNGQDVRMDLQMITPVAVDWDGDGDVDIICGDEDGRVAFIEHTGELRDGVPRFKFPVYFQQEAADVKFGALVTPVSVDWDGDGDEDLICGNTAGYIGFVENLGGGSSPRWAAPRRLREIKFESGGRIYGTLRYEAGPQGSIQGPCEAKWGYTAPSVADWNHDGRLDVVANGIWGKVRWHERKADGELLFGVSVRTAEDADLPKPKWTWWNPTPGELVTQWRTTPCVLDWNEDGLNDLVMLDHEGYLAFYERTRRAGGVNPPMGAGQSEGAGSSETPENRGVNTPRSPEAVLLPPRRVFKIEGPCEFDAKHRTVGDKADGLLRLNARWAGKSGRRKLCFADWDGDGRVDLLVNSVNVNWLRNVRTDDDGFTWFRDEGPLDDRVLAGHTTSPTVVDWDKNGIPDLLVGAEDGFLYYKKNPRSPRVATPGLEGTQSEPRPLGSGSSREVQLAQGPGANALGSEAMVTSEFIYTEAPFPQCHASTIAESQHGLVAAWFGGQHEKSPDVGIWVSRHVDGKWSPPIEVANGVQHTTLRHPCWNPVLHQMPNKGPLLLFYKVGPDPRTWWGLLTQSTDGGQTWSHPCRLPETIDGPVKNKPVLLSDGRLICPSSTEYDGWRVHFEVTTDAGRTWERIGPINDGKTFNAIQPSLLTYADGRLQVLCRSKEGSVVTSWSDDGGLSWSEMERTPLPNPNSGTDAVTLADGRQLLVYNHTQRHSGEPRNRALLNVAVSDNGRDWQAAIVLEHTPKSEFSYPAVIQTADGLVHITYTWERRRVRHVVVDPRKLKLQPIVDGKWPGLPHAGAGGDR